MLHLKYSDKYNLFKKCTWVHVTNSSYTINQNNLKFGLCRLQAFVTKTYSAAAHNSNSVGVAMAAQRI